MCGDSSSLRAEETLFLRWHLEYVVDQIKMADAKANFLLAVYLASLSVAMLQTEKAVDLLVDVSVCLLWKIALGALCLGFLICMVIFFGLFVGTLKPRTDPKEILDNVDYRSVIFWKDVADMGCEDFKNAALENRYRDLKDQVFVNCVIAKTKYRHVTRAYQLLLPTGVILMILYSWVRLIGE